MVVILTVLRPSGRSFSCLPTNATYASSAPRTHMRLDNRTLPTHPLCTLPTTIQVWYVHYRATPHHHPLEDRQQRVQLNTSGMSTQDPGWIAGKRGTKKAWMELVYSLPPSQHDRMVCLSLDLSLSLSPPAFPGTSVPSCPSSQPASQSACQSACIRRSSSAKMCSRTCPSKQVPR